MVKKQQKVIERTFLKFVFLSFLFLFSMGLTWLLSSELSQPYFPLEPRVKLVSYFTFMVGSGGIVMLWGLTIVSLYCVLIKKEKERTAVKTNMVALLGVIVCFLSFLPRYYVEKRVDDAGYVKCINESYSSARTSWDVYAADESLCKEKWQPDNE
ncbi:DUF1240 domain-containing protein [Halodesulfovibrio aestuarii]|uniref:DUF1240 domain-containing protein n=1 Tax=Halodesulfovibrio aestuarii TaxID=126333 RepID=A0ABV4JXA6_9BACT